MDPHLENYPHASETDRQRGRDREDRGGQGEAAVGAGEGNVTSVSCVCTYPWARLCLSLHDLHRGMKVV